MAWFWAGKMTQIDESAYVHFTKPLTFALMITLQVVRALFGFYREYMGSCTPLLVLKSSD